MTAPLDPAAFADRYLPRNERGDIWTFSPYQRRVLALMFRRPYRLRLWSEPKTSGKSLVAAVLGLWWAFTHPKTQVICCANDLEQTSRVFGTMRDLLTENPELGTSAVMRAQEIKLSNGTSIVAIASEYRGSAGARHSLAIFDELWGYDSERAERLYEEMTPPALPGVPDAWMLVVSSAGFAGESVVLERLYERRMRGQRLDAELEVYEDAAMVMFWSCTPRQPWQDAAYYDDQRQSLRESTFDRLHHNLWRSAESTFLPAELWDAATDPDHSPMLPNKRTALYLGVDLGIVNDYAAVVAVCRAPDGDWLELAFHRVWRPSKAEPLDIEDTVEGFLREAHYRYHVARILIDPYQAHRSITTLARAGLPIEPFRQTSANLTRMASALYELIKGGNLRLYPDAELKWMALNTRAIETSRGLRIGKETASKKIDGIIALSMACVGLLDSPVVDPLMPLAW